MCESFFLFIFSILAKEIRFEVLFNHLWRDEMSNRSSPEFKLLSGNIADAVTNELDADLNYITSNVLKMK